MRKDFDGGKYTVIFNEATGELSANRHGEPWRDLVGDNLILAMLYRIDELETEVDYLGRFYAEVEDALGPASDDVYEMIKERYAADGKELPEGY